MMEKMVIFILSNNYYIQTKTSKLYKHEQDYW